MSLTITTDFSELSFAGDPIILDAHTSKTGVTFLRINIAVDVTLSGGTSASHTEEYSCPVGGDGNVTLNISKTIESALDHYNSQTVSGTTLTQSLCKASFTITATETWLEGVQEIEGDTVTRQGFTAISGALTEFERLKAPNYDTAALIGTGCFLSRKPDGEFVPLGDPVYLPVVSTLSSSVSATLSQGGTGVGTGSASADGVSVPVSIRIPTSGAELGEVQVTSQGNMAIKYLVPPSPLHHRFLFLNGFGLAESITAVSREAFSYEVSSEQFVVGREVNYRPNTDVRSFAQAPRGVLKMSSGHVNRAWAEWFIGEFITTRQAWMLVDGRYLPVAIIPEEENVVYDRTKPGLMSVNFSVQYAFTGSTRNSFV